MKQLILLVPALVPLACLCAPSAPLEPAEDPTPPNIVIVFTDDQGYGDIGVQGAEGFHTPNIDRLAGEGVRFTDFYVAQPVCSASRAALLTGCYPNRIGIAGALNPQAKHGIHEDELTLAELCRSKGYKTAAFGKWHLGSLPQFLPGRHGFDEYFGIPYSNDMWPHHPESPKAWPPLPLIDGEQPVGFNTDQSLFTTEFTERAVQFIDRCGDSPFFLYLAHPMPHVPLHVSEKYRGNTEQGMYGDVIEEIDWSVGQVLDALERNRLSDRTLVIFTSDNGPWLSYGNHAGSTGPLREGKGTTFEGGVRVPCVMRWPGRIPAGTVCSEPAMTIDILPTIGGLLEADLPLHQIDGLDIWPLMSGRPGAGSPHEAFFFYYHENQLEAMRSGRWKLHFPHTYRSMSGRELGR
ncbi:MAG: sulfatase, partial [Planctomycetota bacterium]